MLEAKRVTMGVKLSIIKLNSNKLPRNKLKIFETSSSTFFITPIWDFAIKNSETNKGIETRLCKHEPHHKN